MKRFYLCGAIAGIVLPFAFLVRFIMANGLDASEFARQLFQNDIAMFFAMDVLVSALVLWAFVFTEGRKKGMTHLWAYVLCTLFVGVSLALPLFLFFRERRARSSSELLR